MTKLSIVFVSVPICTVWVNPPPRGFLTFSRKWLGIFSSKFTRLFYVPSMLNYKFLLNYLDQLWYAILSATTQRAFQPMLDVLSIWCETSSQLEIIRPPGTWVPHGLLFCPRCFLFRHSFSELPRPIAVKLCHMVGIWPNFIIQVQKFRGRSPKKLGPKHAKFQSILDHFRLWSRISPERGNTSKIGKMYGLEKFFLRLIKKVRWTLVH